jgi:hypothetical protein
VDPRTHLAPDSGLPAWFKARSRVRRARVLFACGQAIAARGDSSGAQRSARLYQRALELLAGPIGSAGAIKSLDRISARDQLRSELRRRSVLGWLRARPRESKLVVSAGVLLLVAFAGFRWLEPDLAEGKRWEASSAWGAFPRVGVMTGDAPIDGRFHTNDEQDPWVRLDLGEARRVHAVRIENRTNCCKERAIPLAIELSIDGENWKVVGYRRVLFDTIRQQFAAQQARYVRLRVDRRSLLHLRRISVY